LRCGAISKQNSGEDHVCFSLENGYLRPTAPGSPWQNGYAERLISTIRRECLDHLVIFSEAHLRQILQRYADYYNKIRTHRSLDNDAPALRAVERVGNITSHAILGELHRHYVWI
jgi:hypothetical protein